MVEYVVIPALILLVGILSVWLALRRVVPTSGKNRGKLRKVSESVVLTAIVAPLAAVAAGATWNAVTALWFRAKNPEPGETLQVVGHGMHINCTGQGSPTIVLDAGLGNDSLIWGGVQPVLAKTTQVCSYDRAGFGLSDTLPAPRDADHIAAELHDLLIQAKVTGPIVLMGHSIAGMYIRDYATRYPSGLAGLIFVDSSTPLQEENPALKAVDSVNRLQWFWDLEYRAELIIGLRRLKGQCSQVIPSFDVHAARLQAEDSCRDRLNAVEAEMNSFSQSGHETVTSGPYGALPILIFSHDPAKSLSRTNPPQKPVNVETAWNQMQENLKALSTCSIRIIAKGSSHYVQIDRADLIEREVSIFIERIRGTIPQPGNYGSTITE